MVPRVENPEEIRQMAQLATEQKIRVNAALDRLNALLGLKARQDQCPPGVADLHRKILETFVEEGRMVRLDEMKQYLPGDDDAIGMLRELDMVTFGADGAPTGAYPFTTSMREHTVRINGYRLHAMCSVDALAVAPMFGRPAQVSSRCRITGTAVEIGMDGATVTNPGEVRQVRVGIDWAAADPTSSCSDSLCTDMVFLRDDAIAAAWHTADRSSREVFTVSEAVELADRFFSPLLQRSA